jgi:hypothetical protein
MSHERPIHGLRSNKNFIVTNAVENILRGSKLLIFYSCFKPQKFKEKPWSIPRNLIMEKYQDISKILKDKCKMNMIQ